MLSRTSSDGGASGPVFQTPLGLRWAGKGRGGRACGQGTGSALTPPIAHFSPSRIYEETRQFKQKGLGFIPLVFPCGSAGKGSACNAGDLRFSSIHLLDQEKLSLKTFQRQGKQEVQLPRSEWLLRTT